MTIRVGDVIDVDTGDQCGGRVPMPNGDRDGQCCRRDLHSGEHAIVSYSGLVIAVGGSPERPPSSALTEEQIAACRQIASACDEVIEAIGNANDIVSGLKRKHPNDKVIEALCNAVELPDEYDLESPIDFEQGPEQWELDVAELMGWS